ncbi:hypothetical protein SAMN05720469_10397 [Fibrobacter intestinalis]|uniref:Uncharacterized protein n=1 Tax=Fibrobacter intestinalis TaxID=28122 RepID=A0A1M6R3B6_9BACT|nr:hypothetical protein BGX14_2573 [Fibrobacter sp. UWS1]SHK26995.1 hypothetical protein SAMN05720469_10397 [Fibrobacter intestinalis]
MTTEKVVPQNRIELEDIIQKTLQEKAIMPT